MHEFHFLNMSETQEVTAKYKKNRVHINLKYYLKHSVVLVLSGIQLAGNAQ